MKVFLVVAALVGIVSASHYSNLRSAESGSSSQYRSDDNAGGYQFGYDEQHSSGGSFRRESSNGGAVTGSYGLTDADGRQRIVHYIADAAGFRAQIETNEPGTEAASSADVVVNRGGQTVVAAAPATKTISAPIALPVPVALPAPTFAPVQQAPIQIRYPPAPVRATFGPAPVASYGVKQAPLPAPVWQAPAPVAAPLPAQVSYQQIRESYQPIRESYTQQIEQAPLIAEPVEATPRAFSYSFSSSHQPAPVAVKSPASFVGYTQQQTQDY